MVQKNSADRMAALEEEVARLKLQFEAGTKPSRSWWEQFAGTFENDPV